ncbi:YncE family protein [Bacillus thuringiensis]
MSQIKTAILFHTVIDTISVGLSPDQVTIIPDGTRAYVTNQASNTVSVIDIATNTVITNIPVGVAPTGIATGTICE